ncbi:hypothetical protein TSUD_150140 [Trifolium subterraneum]|uniref:RNase H type-1 domain-containing protein n=1 Tax=Trifolium subterraneum TaxID=3900 RepID=A0A2Z6M9Z6_TRISU|nr:hypothetical protein TSUD_150140 [Trifolium subterraneum]
MSPTHPNGHFPMNLPILTGNKNYDNWVKQMKVVFLYQDMWGIVTEGVPALGARASEEDKESNKELKKMDYKALFIIHHCVDPDNFEKVGDCESSKEAWDILAQSFGGAEQVKEVKLQTYKRQFDLIQMEESETVSDYFTKVIKLVNQIKNCGEVIESKFVVSKILRSLTPRFDHVVATIETSKRISEISKEELLGCLESNEQRMNERAAVKGKSEVALQVQLNKGKRGKGRGNGNRGRGNYNNGAKDSQAESPNSQKSNNNHGNSRRGYNNRGRGGRKKKEPENNAKLSKQENEDVLLMVTTNEEAKFKDQWYLDSGCSSHMTGRRDWFVSINKSMKSKVKFGNDSTLAAEGVGDVLIMRKDGKQSLIYIPGLAALPPPIMHNTIMGPDTEAWCAYHRCKGHDTERCFRLRDLIEELIRSGHLRKFLEDAAKGQIAIPKQTPNQQKGDGGGESNSARKRYVRKSKFEICSVGSSTFPHTPEISFNPEDAWDVIPHDDDPLVIQVQILNCDVKRVLIDSGSSADILYWDSYKATRLSDDQLNPYSGTLVGFSGEQVDVMGHITLYTTFSDDENAKTIKVRYLVVKTLFTSYNIIIGRPVFNALGAVMSTLYLSIKYPLNNGKVRVVKGDQVLARKCYESSLKIRHRPSKPVLHPVSGERTNEINMVSVTDLDPREEFQDRRVSPIEDLDKVQIGEQPHQTTSTGTSLKPEERERIITVLRNNRDLFAWQPSDMPGIDESVITHKLSVSPINKSVVQRKRKVGEERRAAITEEVAKLKEAGFIEEIKYPTWLENVVMVKKASGKWRMCVDFTDLNKSCPKDPYPLPNIDRIIDGASGYKTLSFMDAYSSYNQIKMHPMDAQHTTFMFNTCNYFYNVMPFGLKNAKATYQRLMDRVFLEQIGKNLEVYIDDMVVKTQKEGEHDKDLDDILKSVRKREGLSLFRHIEKEREGKTLYLYLAVFEKALNSALVQEVGEEKKSPFTLQYFQGHQVIVKKDYPIKNVLRKPDLAGRMVAWSVELSEFNITYIPRGAIKSQALADFVLELTDPPNEGESHPWTLSVDGSSNLRGSGAGVVLEWHEGVLIEQSLRFAFNQAGYEALIAGMKLTKEMEVQELKVQSDSQLVANQVSGEFQTKDPQLAKYLEKVKGMAKQFTMFELTYVPREQNARADLLAKLASTKKPGNHRTVIQETLKSPSINEVEIGMVVEEEDWRSPIIRYLQMDALPLARDEAAKIKKMAALYTMVGGKLYKRAFSAFMLLCVSNTEACRILKEVHESSCRSHIGSRSLAGKVMRVGFYWPNPHDDAAGYVRTYDKCQRYSNLHHAPGEPLKSVISPWSFYMWGVDILGPFPISTAQARWIIVAVDYFTKWVEALPISVFNGGTTLHHGLWSRCYDPSRDTTFHLEKGYFNIRENNAALEESLDLLQELREKAHFREFYIKQRAARKYNTRVIPRKFKEGDLVLKRPMGRDKGGKMAVNWEGPFRIQEAFEGGAYRLQTIEGETCPERGTSPI